MALLTAIKGFKAILCLFSSEHCFSGQVELTNPLASMSSTLLSYLNYIKHSPSQRRPSSLFSCFCSPGAVTAKASLSFFSALYHTSSPNTDFIRCEGLAYETL